MSELLTLRKHQQETFDLAKDKPCWGLFHDPGTGKTGTAITLMRHKMNEARRFLRVLIFVPPIGIKQWKREFGKFSKVPKEKIILLQKEGVRRLKDFELNCFETVAGVLVPKGSVIITNYESLFMKPLFQRFVDWQPEIIVVDESHYVKSHKADRSKLLEFLANPQRGNLKFEKGKDKKKRVLYASRQCPTKEPIKYLLTGTPVANSPMDAFQQYLILDGGKTLGTNFYVFQSRYFYDKNAGMPAQRHFPDWKPRPGAVEELNKLLYSCANRVEKETCLDLPPRTVQTVVVEMGPQQRKLYQDMKRDLIAVVDDKACVAQLAITKMLRLQQMASGFIKTVGEEEIPLDDNPKNEALKQLLENLLPTGKVIVWCAWQHNYKQVAEVCESLGVKYARVVGGMTEKQRTDAVEAFTKGDANVMIANAKAAGMSVDFIEAPYSIGFSQTCSLIDAIQSRARNYRDGSQVHSKIVHYNIVTEDSIEELVVEKLEAKEEMSLELLKQNINRL